MATQYLLSERDYKRVQTMLRWFERQAPKNTLRRLPRHVGGGGAALGIRRARIQSIQAITDGIVSVKLLNSINEEEGDAFNCYAFPGKQESDTTCCLPTLAVGNSTYGNILITLANDANFYMVWPTLIPFTSCE